MAEPWRVAQLAVDWGPGRSRTRGSGYLIAHGRVLTAAHVVAGAAGVRVLLDVGQDTEVDVQAEDWWADPAGPNATDLAVVTIPVHATTGRECEPARFGRIRDCAAVLEVAAFGFPRLKLRADPANGGPPGVIRDLEHAVGHAPVAANRRQRTLEVNLDSPPQAAGPSPWEGMSGGSVWARGRIVAVVAEHHPGEGTGTLTARRIDRAYDGLAPADLAVLAELLGLPSVPGDLRDVVPVEQGQLRLSYYLAQVAESTPDELIDRDGDLAAWAEFCAGPEPYAWWQARPWAGKSALASWFVTHPPIGVDIVSFFITGRLPGQANSDSFLDAMTEQLSALDPDGADTPVTAGARTGAWLTLLETAASQAAERGRRLVVVIDGLDEDEAGAAPPRGRPSIASLLPRRPPPGARFIITSRPLAGLPSDVAAGHRLRECTPRRLSSSHIAEDIGELARQELKELLEGDQIAVDVVGYLAGSGGGLTRSDLLALTGASGYRLDPVLDGVSARTFQARAATGPGASQADPAARTYVFAHITLRELAEQQLGSEVGRYRQRVHEWIDSFADDCWPDNTPRYAVSDYPSLLRKTDLARLAGLARSPARHAFLSRATGSDYATLDEIDTALAFSAGAVTPDLGSIAELAAYRHVISRRSRYLRYLPEDLVAVWAWLGRNDHAEELARAVHKSAGKARALTDMVLRTVRAGDPEGGEELALAITDPGDQARALAELAAEVAQAGDFRRAERLARSITDADTRAHALATLAATVARGGDHDRAEALARAITDLAAQMRALGELVAEIARAGDLDRAEALAQTITDPAVQMQALGELVAVIARAGDPDRAETLAQAITDPATKVQALGALIAVIAGAGDLDGTARLAGQVEVLTSELSDPADQVRMLAWLVGVMVAIGDPWRAGQLIARAEALALAVTDPDARSWMLIPLVTAVARAVDPGAALALTRTITNGFALTQLAIALAQAGYPDHAEALAGIVPDCDVQAAAFAEAVTDPGDQVQVLAGLATAAAEADHHAIARRLAGRAEELIHAITAPADQVQALTGVALAIAAAADPGRAARLADRAEEAARRLTDPAEQAKALTDVASVAAQAGDRDRARRLADRAEALTTAISDPVTQAWAVASLVPVFALAGDPDRAEALAHTVTSPASQAVALTSIAEQVIATGDLARARRLAAQAEALALTISSSLLRSWALTGVISTTFLTGDPDRAEALAEGLAEPGVRVGSLIALASLCAPAGDHVRAQRLADRAEALADTLASPAGPAGQAQAFADLAVPVAQFGDHVRAHQLADRAAMVALTITDPAERAQALAALATAIARAGEADRAGALIALAIPDAGTETMWHSGGYTLTTTQASVFTHLVTMAAQASDLPRFLRLANRAEELARIIADPGRQVHALATLATAIARAGDLARAEALADTLSDRARQAEVFTNLAVLAAQGGAQGPARRLAERAEALVHAIASAGGHETATLATLVTAVARAGDLDRAETLADRLARDPDQPTQAKALTDLAVMAAQAGDVDRFNRLADRVEALARTFTSPATRSGALAALATATAQASDLDRAETLADSIADPADRAKALADLAVLLGQAGDLDRARRLADRAEALAEAIANPANLVTVLSSLVAATAQAGDLDRARRLADRAEALAEAITIPADQAWTLTGLATVIAGAGDPDRAEALVDAISYPLTPAESHARGLTTLAIAAAEAADQARARRLADRAESLARAEASPLGDWALEGLAAALARAGDPGRAEALAGSMSGPGVQARELIGLAEAVADAGDLARAGRLLARALSLAPDGIEWIEVMARVFPSETRDALSILVTACSSDDPGGPFR